ncbi:hypothetical protein BDF20DRAFT_836145 [Mycotypha africana]|uniref:uncharacterized protein n=1 Tax=Mycotypha africana TaxID=64632 RepID=UPI002300805E|nr:uncharacterized protein BDF20DRAFT_836145 [Mycotypha africana]KAI8977330.1 hypothetical protein BDF20DRAFT_836145 [Mycotypha africana]
MDASKAQPALNFDSMVEKESISMFFKLFASLSLLVLHSLLAKKEETEPASDKGTNDHDKQFIEHLCFLVFFLLIHEEQFNIFCIMSFNYCPDTLNREREISVEQYTFCQVRFFLDYYAQCMTQYMSSSAHEYETQQQLNEKEDNGKRLPLEDITDPYAGQYPPPPPLPPEDVAVEQRQHNYPITLQNLQQEYPSQDESFHLVSQQQHHHSNGTTTTIASTASNRTHPYDRMNSQRRSTTSSFSFSQKQKSRPSSSVLFPTETEEVKEAVISAHNTKASNSANHLQQQQHAMIPSASLLQRGHSYETPSADNHHHSNIAATTLTTSNRNSSEYNDSEAVDLREYLRAEREEKLREEARVNGQQLRQSQPTSNYVHSSFGSSVHDNEQPSSYHRRSSSYYYSPSSPYQQHYAPHTLPIAVTSDSVSYFHDRYPHPASYENEFLYNNNNSNRMNHLPSEFSPRPQALFMGPPFHQPLHHHPAATLTLDYSQQHGFPNPSSSSFPINAVPLHPSHHQYTLPTQQRQGSHPSLFSPPSNVTHIVAAPPSPTTMFEKIVTSSSSNGHWPVSLRACAWTFILFIFLCIGVAMIIVSQLISDKCENSSDYRNDPNNVTVCGQVFHNGLLYAGVAIAGILGITIIWRLIRWCCRPPSVKQPF